MRIAICDDRAEDCQALAALLQTEGKRLGLTPEIRVFDSAWKLLEALKTEVFQVFFLDIYMPGLSGVEAARHIRGAFSDAAIVFTTTSSGHMLDGFDIGAVHYLLKPVDGRRVAQALSRCVQAAAKQQKYVLLPNGNARLQVALPSIRWIESINKDCLVNTMDEVLSLRAKLTELLPLLPAPGFLLCHRSFIVNLAHVAYIKDYDFVMRGGALVPIKRQERAQIRELFEDYCFSELRK